MNHLPPSIIFFLLPFSILFRIKKSFGKFLILFSGGILCRSGHTICGYLRVLGMKGEKRFSNYHHLLNRSKIDMLKAAKILMNMVLPLAGAEIILVVDEHLERRRGKKIKAKAIYRDPVASSKKWKVKCFGLKWVVVSMLIKFSWSKRPFALPLFCALRLPEDHPKNLKRKTRSGIDIACQILCVIRRWLPNHDITVLGDGDYARVKLCQVCKRLSMHLVSRLRADARLHYFPIKKKGRVSKKGPRLTRPEEKEWGQVVVNWYGGQIKELAAAAKNCLWLGGKKSQLIELKAIWVKMRAGDEIILMTTNLDRQISAIISAFVSRWNLEVTFRECRDYLGVETQRQWSDTAIARTTPMLFALYTLVVLIGNAIYNRQSIHPESTAWYSKTQLTFSDLLNAVRNELGNVNSLFYPQFAYHQDLDNPHFEEYLASGC